MKFQLSPICMVSKQKVALMDNQMDFGRGVAAKEKITSLYNQKLKKIIRLYLDIITLNKAYFGIMIIQWL